MTDPTPQPTPADDLVEQVARILYARREGFMANADFGRQLRLWDECTIDARVFVVLVMDEAARFSTPSRRAGR